MKLKTLPVAARVRDYENGTVFFIADQSHDTYDGTVLITDSLVNVGCFDAPEPKNSDDEVRQFGSNAYFKSNVHQWLNASGNNWYTPQSVTDTPPSADSVICPYDNDSGFLTGFSDKFLSVLKTVPVTVAYKSEYWLTEHETQDCRVFLPSKSEMGMEKRPEIHEGTPLPLFKEHSFIEAAPTPEVVESHDLSPRELSTATGYPYWLRTCSIDVYSGVCFAGARSPEQLWRASKGSCGIRPMVVLDGDTELEELPDSFGAYVIKKEV